MIYGFAHSRKLDLEEYYGLLAIKLCEVVMRWDKSKSKLSTLYYISADRMIWNEYRRENARKRDSGPMLSLDYLYTSNDGKVKLIDFIGNENIGEQLDDEVVESVIEEQLLSGQYREIIKLRLEGYTQGEISEILNMSQSNISRILNLIYEEYKMGEGE